MIWGRCSQRRQRGAPAGQDFERAYTCTQTHFAAEEQLVSQHGYPATAEHKVYHQELIKRVG